MLILNVQMYPRVMLSFLFIHHFPLYLPSSDWSLPTPKRRVQHFQHVPLVFDVILLMLFEPISENKGLSLLTSGNFPGFLSGVISLFSRQFVIVCDSCYYGDTLKKKTFYSLIKIRLSRRASHRRVGE